MGIKWDNSGLIARLPVQRLARRYATRMLLEQELAGFDEAKRGPQWEPIRQAMLNTMFFLEWVIEHGEQGVADYLASAPPFAPPLKEQTQPPPAENAAPNKGATK